MLKRGELFKHVDGTVYQCMGKLKHAKTGEILVAYKSFKDPTVWAMPADEFAAEFAKIDVVEREK